MTLKVTHMISKFVFNLNLVLPQRLTHCRLLLVDYGLENFSCVRFNFQSSVICTNFFSNRLRCSRCVNGIQTRGPPTESDCTDDFSCWHHVSDKRWVIDPVLKQCWGAGVSFVMYQHSHKQKPIVSLHESPLNFY